MFQFEIKSTVPRSILEMKERLAFACLKTMREEVPKLRNEIIQRTKRGVDVDGGAFPAYSEAYRKRKERKGLPTSPVDLTLSGEMLDLLIEHDVTSEGFKSTISVPSPTETWAAAHNKGIGKMPKRKFMGLSKDQKAYFKRILLENIKTFFNR